MTGNTNLRSAKRAKNDEFYTRLEDVEDEVQHYPNAFREKVVYLNSDDERSAFWEYFSQHFTVLGLNELVATKYPEGLLFRLKTAGGAVEVVELEGDGDFRSPECVSVLEQADVVVTNPPFSLFREYVAQLMEYGKKFLVIGNMNAITYKEIWPLIQAGDLWLGTKSNMALELAVPEDYFAPEGAPTDHRGRRLVKVPGINWFTNLDHAKRHSDLPLAKNYTPEEYPRYDNYDAIEVSKVKDIPTDYDGVMGVPITFLGKWNPDQFEILSGWNAGVNVPNPGAAMTEYEDRQGETRLWNGPTVDRKTKYYRILIRRRQFDRV